MAICKSLQEKPKKYRKNRANPARPLHLLKSVLPALNLKLVLKADGIDLTGPLGGIILPE